MTTRTTPEVTILLCVWNGEEWIREAIDSCLAQKHISFELLLMDDGSTDGTPAILREYARENPGVVRVRTLEHAGLAAARNVGFDDAWGEFVTIMDADDTMHPLRCYGEVQGLRRFPNAVICFSKRWNFISGSDKGLYRFRSEELLGKPSTDYYEIDDPIRTFIEGGEYPGTSACTVRTAFSRSQGKYDESLNCFEDGDMWLRSVFDKTVVYCPAPLYLRRVHSNSMSQPSIARLDLIYGSIDRARAHGDRYKPEMLRSLRIFEQRAGLSVVRAMMDSGSRGAAIGLMFRYAPRLFGNMWLRMLVRAVLSPALYDSIRRRRGGGIANGERSVTLEQVMAVDVAKLLALELEVDERTDAEGRVE